MRAVVPSVLQFALIKHYEVLIFQLKMRKPLRRAQPAFRTLALPPFSRVGCAAKVCAFLFEILRLHSVASVQIAALGTTAHISVCVLAISRKRNQTLY